MSEAIKYNIILASNSPRRKELMAGLDLDFQVKVIPGIDESYPSSLSPYSIPEYLAKRKADAYLNEIAKNDVIITADTIVIVGRQVVGKPHNSLEARNMLRLLSGKTHEVVTGVCITYDEGRKRRSFSSKSEVTFDNLSDNDIDYYVSRYSPLDKAGAYGIQEWIGFIAISSIKGSFYNVMGLPIQRIFSELRALGILSPDYFK